MDQKLVFSCVDVVLGGGFASNDTKETQRKKETITGEEAMNCLQEKA